MGWAMPDEREEFTLAEFVAAFTLERISLGGPVFDLQAHLAERQVPASATPPELLARLRRGRFRTRICSRCCRSSRSGSTRSRASSTTRGSSSRARSPTTRTRSRRSSRRAARPARREGCCGPLSRSSVDPLLDWRPEALEARIRGFAERRGLARGGAVHDACASRHGPGGLAAALRDAGRPRQGGLPPAARGRDARERILKDEERRMTNEHDRDRPRAGARATSSARSSPPT